MRISDFLYHSIPYILKKKNQQKTRSLACHAGSPVDLGHTCFQAPSAKVPGIHGHAELSQRCWGLESGPLALNSRQSSVLSHLSCVRFSFDFMSMKKNTIEALRKTIRK